VSQSRPLALITGASAGIGAEFARQLAATHDLILVARRADRLDAVARELSSRGCHAQSLAADLGTSSGCDLVAARLSAEPPIALLINNAGFGARGPFWELPLDEQLRMHDLHVTATLRLTHAALAAFVPRGRGAVINVASVAAYVRGAGSASYCATKSWMTALTEGIALDLRRRRSAVTIQALCPGFTYSEFHDVAGMDRTKLAPKSWWYSAERVVEESLAGLERDRIFVIPGFRYRALVRATSLIPRSWRRAALLAMARRNGRITAAK
jgi:hypothetical protein